MIKRLEQVAALVVAAGLAIVSYWLFFSWAGGGDTNRRQQPSRSALPRDGLRRSEPAARHDCDGGDAKRRHHCTAQRWP